MYKNKKILGIIPARSGSKKMPHKNIRMFMGKPLIAWTILATRRSGVVDEIFVSTDSERYAMIAKRYGANVPFLRPDDLSGDTNPASDYIIHAINEYNIRYKRTFDYFILLQPTSPLRTPEQIRDGVAMAVDGDYTSIVAFSPYHEDLRLVRPLPEDMNLADAGAPNDTLRQESERLYRVNGMIYISRCETYADTKSFYGPKGKAMIIDSDDTVDIDDESDFQYAEYLANRSGRYE